MGTITRLHRLTTVDEAVESIKRHRAEFGAGPAVGAAARVGSRPRRPLERPLEGPHGRGIDERGLLRGAGLRSSAAALVPHI